MHNSGPPESLTQVSQPNPPAQNCPLSLSFIMLLQDALVIIGKLTFINTWLKSTSDSPHPSAVPFATIEKIL